MDHRSIVARNSLLFLLAGIVGHLYVLATVPILTRLLAADEWGFFVILLQLNVVLQYAALVLFSQSLLKFYAEYADTQRRLFIGTSLVALMMLQVLFLSSLFLWRAPLLPALYPNLHLPLDPIVGWACFWFLAAPLRMFGLAVLKIKEQARQLLLLNFAYGVALFPILLYLVVWRREGLLGAVQAMALAEWIALGLTAFLIRAEVTIAFVWRYLLRSASFAAPLLGSTACFLFVSNIDRWALSRHVDLSTLGTYGAAATIANSLALVVTAVMTSTSPRIISVLTREGDVAAGKLASSTLVDSIMFVGLPFGLLCLGADLLAAIMVGDSSASAIATGVVIAVATGHMVRSVYLAAQNVLFYRGKTGLLLLNGVLLAALAGLLAPLLAAGGALGISWLLACSYLLLAPLTFIWARRLLQLTVSASAVLYPALGIILALCASLGAWWMDWNVRDWQWWLLKGVGAIALLATCIPGLLKVLSGAEKRFKPGAAP